MKQRQSSLELLRILALLPIIAYHYAIYSGFPAPSCESFGGQMLFVQLLMLFGRPACSLFALISGYFLIDTGCEGHYRRIVPLIAKRSFYSLAILIVLTVANRALPHASIAARSLLPTGGYNWYVYYYILFYFFLPILNPMLRSLERKSFARLLLLALAVWSLLPSLGVISGTIAPYWSLS